MGTLDVTATVTIDRPAEVVWSQFADVAHHEESGLHRGVRFEVIEDDGRICRYRQTSRVGPVSLRQEVRLDRGDGPLAPLVNEITAGQLSGGSISFLIEPDGSASATVVARVRATLGPLQGVVRPILARQTQRNLERALGEDKADLETGNYLMPSPSPASDLP